MLANTERPHKNSKSQIMFEEYSFTKGADIEGEYDNWSPDYHNKKECGSIENDNILND